MRVEDGMGEEGGISNCGFRKPESFLARFVFHFGAEDFADVRQIVFGRRFIERNRDCVLAETAKVNSGFVGAG